MTFYLIGYDVTDKKRLIRVHKFLQNYAFPIQKSIFLFHGNELNASNCINKVKSILNLQEDALCCYQLPKRGFKSSIGTQLLPDGIFVSPLKLE